MRPCVLVLLLVPLAVFGQGDRGSITGTISDPAGAVVASAPVEARNVATGAVYRTATTATGSYSLGQLPPGAYEINVAVAGFKKYVRQGLTLQALETVRADATLEVGASTESVTVNEAAPLLKTESGELSHNIAAQRINELPIGSLGAIRNPLTVTQMIPGTNYVGANTIRLQGTPVNSEQVRIEGLDSTYSLGMSTYSFAQPSVDAVEEVAVQTSNFAAEFGLAAGAVFNITMKSGANSFHGSAYDYMINEAFNASGPFTHTTPVRAATTTASPSADPCEFPRSITVTTRRSSSLTTKPAPTLRSTPPVSTRFLPPRSARAISAPSPLPWAIATWVLILSADPSSRTTCTTPTRSAR